MLCTAETVIKKLTSAAFLEQYWQPETLLPLCKSCPHYGKVWSCPPGSPGGEGLGRYKNAFIIGVKVIYSPEARARALVSAEETERVRQETYGAAKKKVFRALLQTERKCAPALTVAAGRCELCPVCARESGLMCRNPWALRHSFSAYGFDLGRISQEVLGIPLLWAKQGLPEYNMAIYALMTNSETLQG